MKYSVPNNLKFRRYFRLKLRGSNRIEKSIFGLSFGSIGLQAVEFGKIYPKQVEAMRKAIRRGLRGVLKDRGKQRSMRTKPLLSFQLFPYSSLTKKGLGRMGGGKGAHDKWMRPIRKGYIICEVYSTTFEYNCIGVIEAMRAGQSKLPFKVRIVKLIY